MKSRQLDSPYLKLSLAALILFIVIGLSISFFPNQILAIDMILGDYFYNIGPNWLTSFLQTFTLIGDTAFVTPLVIVVVAVCWLLAKKFWLGLWYGLNVLLGASFLKDIAKNLFMRERPSHIKHLIEVTEWSFPSGHAMVAIIAYGGLLFVLLKYGKLKAYKWPVIILLLAIMLTLGFSRLYLGVHYVSDIVAGYSLGLAWLFFTIALSPKHKQSKQLE